MGLRRTPMRRAAATLLVIASTALAACSGPPAVPATQAYHPAGTVSAGGTCSPSLPPHPLPLWARAGFTPPDTPMPQVLGAHGDIIAILWAPKNPLWAPPLPDRGNKILWVARVPDLVAAPMRIFAVLTGTATTVSVTLPTGPGPSLVNMSAPGCWIMHLTWAGYTDVVRLRYSAAPGRPGAQA